MIIDIFNFIQRSFGVFDQRSGLSLPVENNNNKNIIKVLSYYYCTIINIVHTNKETLKICSCKVHFIIKFFAFYLLKINYEAITIF